MLSLTFRLASLRCDENPAERLRPCLPGCGASIPASQPGERWDE